MTCPLPRSRTAVTVVVQDWPFRGCTTIVCTDELRGQRGGIAEVDGAPVTVVQAVRSPAWERSIQDRRGSLDGLGCGHVDEHAFALEGGLDGGADPGAGVDMSLGTQAGEGVVDVWRDTDQQ